MLYNHIKRKHKTIEKYEDRYLIQQQEGAKVKLTTADITVETKAARDKARATARAYKSLTPKRYNYWRAIAAATTYGEILAMFGQGTEHKIPDMAVEAIASYEHARDNDTLGMGAGIANIAAADGRRDAFATVADWMATEEDN